MSEPIIFTSASPNFGFPLLFSGQSQKEVFVNQTVAMIDALLPRSVVASQATPPTQAADGGLYRVMETATDEWAGHEHSLALRIAGAWQFIKPTTGMFVYDSAAKRIMLFEDGWRFATQPSSAQGGTVVDTEARTAIDEISEALQTIGIFPVA